MHCARPYTFIVMALLILLSTPLVLIARWRPTSSGHQYSGHQHHLELRRPVGAGNGRSASPAANERSLTTTVNDIEHIESQSLAGICHHQDFLPCRPPISRPAIRRKWSSIEQKRKYAQMPPGITPPLIIKYSASSMPVIQLGPVKPDLDRAGAVRYRRQSPAAAIGHHPRRSHTLPVWRQDAPCIGRSWITRRCCRRA